MLSRLKAVAVLLLAIAVSLQVYLRIYPFLKPGCNWAVNTKHRVLAFGDPQITGFLHLQRWRKKLDILGNDRYLAQVAESVRYARAPDYVIVLGDLLSSQWIPDDEFELRVERYNKIFQESAPGDLVSIAGNHDIGYHGEITEQRISRFERRFGKVNRIVHQTPEWRLIVVNSLTMDGPPYTDAWHDETIEFLSEITLNEYNGSTVLITHIPLYKPEGICRDGPKFEHYPQENGAGLKQQNHLSYNSTQLLLDSVFGESGTGIILAGHDHEGCLSSYYYNASSKDWECSSGLQNEGVKEITLRSVMGEFGGNSGFVSGVLDPNTKKLQWEFSLCPFHVQHIWWVTEVLTIIGFSLIPVVLIL